MQNNKCKNEIVKDDPDSYREGVATKFNQGYEAGAKKLIHFFPEAHLSKFFYPVVDPLIRGHVLKIF